MAKKKEVATKMIKVKPSVHLKVAKEVAGTTETIGGYFEQAATEKLKQSSKK